VGRALTRPPVLCFLAALAWHFYWASTVPSPADWDPAYYLEVARHLAAGDGAVTEAVWNLGWLPPSLRHPADLHWMPLPSRVLVPFVGAATDDWPAAQLCSVVLAACWAPLAWAWARRLDATEAEGWVAGLLAATAAGYTRTITTPDSIALYGLLGGALLLAASRRQAVAVPLAMAVALTRGDGFLLGLAAALAWPALGGWRVALAGVGATVAWYARGYLVAGQGWIDLRARVAESLVLQDVISLPAPSGVTLGARLGVLGEQAGSVLTVGLIAGMVLIPGFAAITLARRSADRGLWPIVAYAVVFPPVVYLLAPAMAREGTVYRSDAALFVPACALAAVGASRLTRRYHPAFLPGLLMAGVLAGSVYAGRLYASATSWHLDDCGYLEQVPSGLPVMSYDPIGVAARCGRPGIIMARGQGLAELADRYGIDWALVAPPAFDNGTVRAEDWNVDGWERVDERVFRRR